jgi:hypothetical protein
MRIVIDECLASKELIYRLRRAGHDVESSRAKIGAGVSDENVYATEDFHVLHDQNHGNHCGILTTHNQGKRRSMNDAEITNAVCNVEKTFLGCGIRGQCLPLNAYQWDTFSALINPNDAFIGSIRLSLAVRDGVIELHDRRRLKPV